MSSASDSHEDPARFYGHNGVFVAHSVFPPPVTGMSACTQSVFNYLSQFVETRRFDWSNGASRIGAKFRLVKAFRALLSPFRLLLSARPANAVFYMPVNSGFAIFYNVAAVAAARLKGYRCAVHHHNFRYLDRYDWRIALLSRVLGEQDRHVVLCEEMERQLGHLYGDRTPRVIVPSTIQLMETRFGPTGSQPTEDLIPFKLGHIANLQVAKGLDLALETFRHLHRQGKPVRLVLAGPIDTAAEQRLIDEALREFGEAIDYRGPVYDSAKRKFFEDIHASVYPTRNDAQPLVVSESLAFGKPIVTFGRGCIPSMLGSTPRWVVPIDEDFTEQAIRQITSWIEEPQSYREACQAARRQYDDLVAEASGALRDFRDWILHDSDSDRTKTNLPTPDLSCA